MTRAGDQQGRARVGKPVEHLPQIAAEYRVQAHGRLVEHQHVGAAEQGDGEAHPGELAAGERAGHAALEPRQAEVGDRPRDGVGQLLPAQPEHGAEIAQVLGQREVRVDGRILGGVPDAGSQLRMPGRQSEQPYLAGGYALHTDERAQQRGLAAAARPEQPGDLPANDPEGQAVEDRVPASAYHEVAAPDDGLGGRRDTSGWHISITPHLGTDG